MATFNAGFNLSIIHTSLVTPNAPPAPQMLTAAQMLRSPGMLEKAVVSNNVDLVKSLLEQDLVDDSELLRAFDDDPLIQIAAKFGYEEVVDLLIASKHQLPESQRKQSWGEALMLAVRGGHGEVVRSLCVALQGVNHRGLMGNTALMEAVKKSDLEMVNALLFYDADFNAINAFGETPLTLAVLNEDLPVLQALLAHDARASEADERLDLEAVGYGAVTAMEQAVLMRHEAQNPTYWATDKAKLEAAEQMIQALRNSKAAEVDKSAAQILTEAYWRKASGPDAATTRLLNEVKEIFQLSNGMLLSFMSREERIRLQNFEYFQWNQAQGLAHLEQLYGHL